MGKIDYDRKYSHEELSAAWMNNLHKIGKLPHAEKWERYYELGSCFRSVTSMDYTNMLNVRYNEEKKIAMCEFENLPGIEYGTIYEIHNITDETHAWRVVLTFLTMLFLELHRVVPKTTVEDMIQQNKEAVTWAKNQYVAQK